MCLYTRSENEIMSLFQENGAPKAEIELMKEKLEQTIKHVKNIEIQINRLRITILRISAKQNSNGKVVQEYLEKDDKSTIKCIY